MNIDVFWLRTHEYFGGWKNGGIAWGNNDNIGFTVDVLSATPTIQFQYSCTETDQSIQYAYSVRLEATPCHFGGIRYWFICPLARNGVSCGRRVAKLYLADKYFGCRHCYGLVYDSQNYGKYETIDRMFRADKQSEELLNALRVRYWKGIPTKKYQRYLRLRKISTSQAKLFLEQPKLLKSNKGV